MAAYPSTYLQVLQLHYVHCRPTVHSSHEADVIAGEQITWENPKPPAPPSQPLYDITVTTHGMASRGFGLCLAARFRPSVEVCCQLPIAAHM